MPERPVMLPPPVRINSPMAHEAARVAVNAIGASADTLPYFKQQFEERGYIDEYVRLSQMAANTFDTSQAAKVSQAIRLSMLKHGISPDQALRTDPEVKGVVEESKKNLELVTKNPIAYDAIKQAQQTPPTQPQDVYDVEDEATATSEQGVLETLTKVLGEGKSMYDAIQELQPDRSAPSAVGGFLQSMVSFVTTLPQAVAANKEFDLGLELKSLAVGEVHKALVKKIIETSPADRDVLLARLNRWVKESPVFFSDYSAFAFLDEVLTPIVNNTTEGPLGNITSTAFPAIDLTGIKGLAHLTTGLTSAAMRVTAVPVLKMMQRASKPALSNELVDVLKSSEAVVEGKYNVSKATIAQTQLPSMLAKTIDDVPDVAGRLEAERVTALADVLSAAAQAAKAELHSVAEKKSLIESTVEAISSAKFGKLRPGRATISPYADGTGFEARVMYGKSDEKGFGTLRDAITQAKTALKSGAGDLASIWSSDGVNISALMTLDEAAELSAAELKRRGNFYVQVTSKHTFTALDYLTSPTGHVMDITKGILGRFRNIATNPSSWFDRDYYRRYNRLFSLGNSINSKLDAIATPVWDLPWQSKMKVNQAMEWSATFGSKNKRNPTMREVQEQFGETLSEKELRGVYSARVYFDALHMLENSHVYEHLLARGAKTIKAKDGSAAFHGVPVPAATAASDVTRVFNVATGKIEDMSKDVAEALYKSGGTIIKTDLAPAVNGTDEIVYHVKFDPKDGKLWEFGNLSSTPLKYIHGYFPRMYEDPYVITRVIKGAMVDGKSTTHRSAVMMAGSRKEAEAARDALLAKNTKDNYTYEIKKDVRLSGLDDVATTQELMQMEGRLFYDDRTVHLESATGGLADIVAPINTIAKSARVIARQLSMEDFNNHMLRIWELQYKDLLKNAGVTINLDVNSVDSALEALRLVANTPGYKKLGTAALESFRYIQYMRGVNDPTSHFFRSKMIAMGEWLYDSGLLGKTAGKAATRGLWKFDALQAAKELTYFDFIIANPLKQYVLNVSQHTFLMALDPAYMATGRAWMDARALRQGIHAQNMIHTGYGEVSEAAMRRNAALMRVSPEEYALLVNRYAQSGMPNNVNIRAVVGEVPLEAADIPMSKAGHLASKAWGAATLRPLRRKAEQKGIVSGEGFNQAISFLLAVRKTMKANKLKQFSQLTNEQWSEATKTAIDYTSAMIRPNTSRYQTGVLGLAFQFMSFFHKSLLTMTFMNKAFTRKEAGYIIAGQVFLFGADSYGMSSLFEREAADLGITDPALVEAVSGGFIDWTLDNVLQSITGDEKADSDFSGYFAPLGSISRVAQTFVDLAFNTAPIEGFSGVSWEAGSRILKAGRMALDILAAPDDVSWNEKKALHALDAIAGGLLSGYSRAQQAAVANSLGYWQAANGQISSVKARIGEVVLSGMLSVSPEEFRIRSNLTSAMRDSSRLTKDLIESTKSDAENYYERILRLVVRYSNDEITEDMYKTAAALEKEVIIATRDPVEKFAFYTEFNALRKNRPIKKPSLEEAIVKAALGKGGQPKEWMFAAIRMSNMPTEEADRVVAALEAKINSAEEAVPLMIESLNAPYPDFIPNE
jgi:hypothetical protein